MEGKPEGEIALIFAAEIELLLGSFAARTAEAPAIRPQRKTGVASGYLICIGILSSSPAACSQAQPLAVLILTMTPMAWRE